MFDAKPIWVFFCNDALVYFNPSGSLVSILFKQRLRLLDRQNNSLKANSASYIPKGAVQYLTNEAEDVLHLVEVKSGSY